MTDPVPRPRVETLADVAMLRFDVVARTWRDVPGSGELARALLAAGAAVDGDPHDRETPLITAASYGDAEVARVLVEAGADLERRAAPNAGGVPGGTALLHAAVFGMTAVLDVLVRTTRAARRCSWHWTARPTGPATLLRRGDSPAATAALGSPCHAPISQTGADRDG